MSAHASTSTLLDARPPRTCCAAGPRRPPYGREFASALSAGRNLNVRLFANRPDPWSLARQHRLACGPASTLVLPVDADPEGFRWPEVRSLVANVTGLPGETLHALARALIRDGCRLAYLLDANCPGRNLRVVARKAAP